MKLRLRRNLKLLTGASVLLTTVAFQLASMLVFDRYPLPIRVVLVLGWLVGGTLQILGSIEVRKQEKEKAAVS